MHGFMVAFAKRLNAMLARAGRVWADRYYARDIVGSREMRNVLSYVFHNARKHGALPADSQMPDLYSTALSFDGRPQPRPRTRMFRSWWRSHEPLRLLTS